MAEAEQVDAGSRNVSDVHIVVLGDRAQSFRWRWHRFIATSGRSSGSHHRLHRRPAPARFHEALACTAVVTWRALTGKATRVPLGVYLGLAGPVNLTKNACHSYREPQTRTIEENKAAKYSE